MSVKYYYIRANGNDINQHQYNKFAKKYSPNQDKYGNKHVWVIDWVGDVSGMVITEVEADKYNEIINSRSYGKSYIDKQD